MSTAETWQPLVDAISAFAELIISLTAGATSLGVLMFLLFAGFAIVAVATAKPKERSKAALRVLELLSRTKHPPG